ncbi:hypothetical protein RSAG8_13600, partial [Rhizoctonia solani AG-8 WAC10335]
MGHTSHPVVAGTIQPVVPNPALATRLPRFVHLVPLTYLLIVCSSNIQAPVDTAPAIQTTLPRHTSSGRGKRNHVVQGMLRHD